MRKHNSADMRAWREGVLTLHGSHGLYKSRLALKSLFESNIRRVDMAEEVSAPAAAAAPAPAPAKAAKAAKSAKPARKKGSTKRSKDGITLPKRILGILAESKDRKGMSVPAIKKNLSAKGVDLLKENKRINLTLGRMENKGLVVQLKGKGASGSFKLAKTEAAKKEKREAKSPARAKKPVPKKSPVKKAAKKAAGKKKSSVKKTVEKKPSPKKAVKPRSSPKKKPTKPKPSPKKSSKKQAPKVSKKTTPRKVNKRPAKKTAARKSKK